MIKLKKQFNSIWWLLIWFTLLEESKLPQFVDFPFYCRVGHVIPDDTMPCDTACQHQQSTQKQWRHSANSVVPISS